MAGCSKLNEVRVFDRTNDNKYFGKVSNLKKGIYSVDFANIHDAFAYCGGDGIVHVLQMNKIPLDEREEWRKI